MACRLFGAEPFSEPVLAYCFKKDISMKFETKYDDCNLRKRIWKCPLQNGGHFVPASVS